MADVLDSYEFSRKNYPWATWLDGKIYRIFRVLGAGAIHDSWWPQVPLLGFGNAMTVTVALIFVVAVFRGVSAILEGVAEAE